MATTKTRRVSRRNEIPVRQCKGCGKVKKERKPDLRARKGRLRKIWETVFGFKAWVVWDPNSKLPLALRFTTIEFPDITMARAVVEQAIANLGDYAKIASLACDKAFLDGAFLWWLNLQGIIFYIPARTDMHVPLAMVKTALRSRIAVKWSDGPS